MRQRETRKTPSRLAERTKRHAHNAVNGRGNACLLLPDGIKTFEPKKEDSYEFDILPYIITKPNHPDGIISGEDFKEGDEWYRRPYGIHKNVGGTGRNVLCPKYTFGKPCPMCEEVANLYDEGFEKNEKLIRAVKAQKMCLFVIRINGKITLMDLSSGKFANELEKEINKSKDHSVYGMALLEGGKTIRARFIEGTFEKSTFFKCDRIDFIDRDDIDESIRDEIPSLDDLFKETSYEDIKKLFLGLDDDEPGETSEQEEEEEQEEEPPRRTRKVKETPPAEEEEEEEQEEEQTPPPRKRKRPEPEPEEEEEDNWNDEEEEEEEPPARKKKTSASKSKPKEPEETEDDDWEEEEPPKKKSAPSKLSKKKEPEPEEEDDDDWDDEE